MFQSRGENYEEEEDELSFEFGDRKLTNTASQWMPIQSSSKNSDLYYEEKDSSWKDFFSQLCQCFRWKTEGSESEHLKVNNRSLYTRS
jgi:hypothetical protein